MARKGLVDSLVVGEYRGFAEDPLGYSVDREDCVGRLVEDGASPSEAGEAWRSFERRYLVHDGGGLTLSAHGIDRAEALGETVYLDNDVQSELVDALDEDGGGTALGSLADRTGADEEALLLNLWMLRRRGVVETRTDISDGGSSVALTEP